MKKVKKIVTLPKELVKPAGIDMLNKGEAVEFLCREYGAGQDCRFNGAVDEGDDILF